MLKDNDPASAVAEATMSGSDMVGRVAMVEGRVLRGIYPESTAEVQLLLSSGLIDELTRRRLFPKTIVSDTNLPGFQLTLEHDRIHPFPLQSEWTFSMFRHAAVALLEVNRIAKEFGYETKDANLHNVTFVGTRPIFFDFGSFQRIGRPGYGWSAYNLYVRDVLWPLTLRRQGDDVLFRMLLDSSFENALSNEEYIRLRMGLFARWISVKVLAFLKRSYAGMLSLGWCSDAEFDQRMTSAVWRKRWGRHLFKVVRDSRLSDRRTADFERLKQHVLKMRKPALSTVWGGYQDAVFDHNAEPVWLTPRYKRVLQLLADLKLTSVVEIAGNMGGISLAIYLNGIAPKVTCTDYDEQTVESAYELFRHRGGESCTAARVNFIEDNRSVRIPDVPSRYRSDAVVALAVTHHLVLTQGIQGDLLMRRFSDFCDRYALIEFMPYGLWDNVNRSQIQARPAWYTIDWFRSNFLRYFDPLLEEELEENRVAFLGRKRVGA